MSGLGKQLRGSGIAKIQNQRTSFGDGGGVDKDKGIAPVEKGIKEIDPIYEAFLKGLSQELLPLWGRRRCAIPAPLRHLSRCGCEPTVSTRCRQR
jgi:hypothetical protein